MRVIDLHDDVLAERLRRIAALVQLAQDELRRAGDEEVLLIDAQQATRVVAVIRIEEERQVAGDVRLVEFDALADDRLVDGRQVEQVQRVAPAIVAGHIHINHDGLGMQRAQRHREAHARFPQPALLRDPRVLLLRLLMIAEALVKQPLVVADARAVAAKAQRRDGI